MCCFDCSFTIWHLPSEFPLEPLPHICFTYSCQWALTILNWQNHLRKREAHEAGWLRNSDKERREETVTLTSWQVAEQNRQGSCHHHLYSSVLWDSSLTNAHSNTFLACTGKHRLKTSTECIFGPHSILVLLLSSGEEPNVSHFYIISCTK